MISYGKIGKSREGMTPSFLLSFICTVCICNVWSICESL